jgi:acyl carrier protein
VGETLSARILASPADFFEQLWCCCNTLAISTESPTAERIAWFAAQRIQRNRGLAMSIAGLTSTEQTTAIKAVFAANDVRALIANHLGVSVGRVTDEAHFTNDLGADWLDRLDLMIAVEAQFTGVEISNDVIDRIELVGDLIRHIETLDSDRRRGGAAPVSRSLFGPDVARAMKSTKHCDEAALFF